MASKTQNLDLNISYSENDRTSTWIDGLDSNFETLDATIGAVLKGISDAGLSLATSVDLIDDFGSGCTELTTTLPSASSDIKAARIGKVIYLFYGNSSSASKVYSFNTSTYALVDTNTYLPSALSQFNVESDGSTIYLLGGKDGNNLNTTVYAFDGTTFTSFTTPLSAGKYNASSCLLGSVIYLFGGYNSNGEGVNTVVTYNFSNEHTEVLNHTLPVPLVEANCFSQEEFIYILGGYNTSTSIIQNTIYRLNATTKRITTLGTALPVSLKSSNLFITNSRIYLLGGESTSGAITTCYQYDVNNAVFIEKPEYILPLPVSSSGYCFANYKGYIFGGQSNTTLDSIIRFTE